MEAAAAIAAAAAAVVIVPTADTNAAAGTEEEEEDDDEQEGEAEQQESFGDDDHQPLPYFITSSRPHRHVVLDTSLTHNNAEEASEENALAVLDHNNEGEDDDDMLLWDDETLRLILERLEIDENVNENENENDLNENINDLNENEVPETTAATHNSHTHTAPPQYRPTSELVRLPHIHHPSTEFPVLFSHYNNTTTASTNTTNDTNNTNDNDHTHTHTTTNHTNHHAFIHNNNDVDELELLQQLNALTLNQVLQDEDEDEYEENHHLDHHHVDRNSLHLDRLDLEQEQEQDLDLDLDRLDLNMDRLDFDYLTVNPVDEDYENWRIDSNPNLTPPQDQDQLVSSSFPSSLFDHINHDNDNANNNHNTHEPIVPPYPQRLPALEIPSSNDVDVDDRILQEENHPILWNPHPPYHLDGPPEPQHQDQQDPLVEHNQQQQDDKENEGWNGNRNRHNNNDNMYDVDVVAENDPHVDNPYGYGSGENDDSYDYPCTFDEGDFPCPLTFDYPCTYTYDNHSYNLVGLDDDDDVDDRRMCLPCTTPLQPSQPSLPASTRTSPPLLTSSSIDPEPPVPPVVQVQQHSPAALDAVQFLLDTFQATTSTSSTSTSTSSSSSTTGSSPQSERIGYGHKERIMGLHVSACGRMVATASQDGTARIWNAHTHQVHSVLDVAGREYECLRVAFAPVEWQWQCRLESIIKNTTSRRRRRRRFVRNHPRVTKAASTHAGEYDPFSDTNTGEEDEDMAMGVFHSLLATGGADGKVMLWGCCSSIIASCSRTDDPDVDVVDVNVDPLGPYMTWKRITTLHHAQLDHFVPVSDTDTPQVYALQFIPHWQSLPLRPGTISNSFLLTSSDDVVHLWEVFVAEEEEEKHENPLDHDDEKNRDQAREEGGRLFRLREVMSVRFGQMHETGYGVHLCSVSGEGLYAEDTNHHLQQHQPLQPGKQTNSLQVGGIRSLTTNDTCKPASSSPSTITTSASSSHSPSFSSSWRFGGERNPDHLVYVFDCSYCSRNGLLGVALSDGSLRLLNGRGVCVTILHLPGMDSHLTSFAWDSTGTRLATTVATGLVITWRMEFVDDSMDPSLGIAQAASCVAVLNGGHERGRAVFGAAYCGVQEEILLSWGADGRLVAWDSTSAGQVQAPLSTLLCKDDYPIYALGLRQDGIVLCGGGSEASFVGIPIYLYDFVKK